MTDIAARIRENLVRVRERMESAAARSGRSADSVTLVAVTKYVSPDIARLLAEAGCRDLGESRPQQLWEKAAALADVAPPPIRWHMIGPLQRNKIARTLPLVSLLHSGESVKLLRAVQEEARQQQFVVPLLLEVNVSGDPAKHGFCPHELEPLLAGWARFDHLCIQGLMAMAGRESDPAATRAEFAQLRELRDRLSAMAPGHVKLTELSMGMSGDFEAAIEEGATMVRIGSALFEGLGS